MADLPACGLYRTTRPLADAVPAGRLVYFHNHGDPGAGVYLPESWHLNHARFGKSGVPVPSPEWAQDLQPLAPEGFYRVREPFYCCADQCRQFEADLVVQLGYDAQARPLLFVPEWTEEGLAIPEQGTRIDEQRIARLAPLKLAHGALPREGDPH